MSVDDYLVPGHLVRVAGAPAKFEGERYAFPSIGVAGLTKREYIATAAMAAIAPVHGWSEPKVVAKQAAALADALLEELAK